MLPHFLLACAIYTVTGNFHPPEVKTHLGNIIGKSVSFNNIPVKTFQSIPYAKPPTDELRFKKPQPVESWQEPLVADKLPPACVQYTDDPYPWRDDLPGKSQNCLYLNIWAPETAGLEEKKAIMFWIHGGGYKLSSSRVDFYNGIALAALGDVIVVTTNYRLSTEGFLFSGTDDAPGNMGLFDILEALKWVKRNIMFFGGDENNITLFGQSSGAITIGMFMTSPLAKGLFARAILESGSPANLAAENNNKDFELTQNVSEAVGCTKSGSLKNSPEKVVECLRDKSAFKLAEIEAKISSNSLRGYYPRYGDEILPYNCRKAIRNGLFNDVDTLIGVNHNDGAAIISKSFRDVFGFFGEKQSQINKTFGERIIKKNFESFPDPDSVVKHYLGHLKEDDYDKVLYEVQTASADFSRVCPSIYLAEHVAKKGSKVQFYFFVHRPTPTPWAPWMGAMHFDEVYFVFGYPLRYPSNYTENEKLLSIQMIEAWSSFAKFGPDSLLEFWPLYSSEQHRYFTFGTTQEKIGTGPHLENCEFFRPYFGF